ncbi:hypothetical protein VTI74DRAFT_6774 [Chaetomium olivicolor]
MSRNSATEVKFRSSCDACLNTKVKCSQTKPSCTRCIRHGYKCVYSRYRKIGRPSLKARPLADQRPLEQQTLHQQQAPHTETAATEQHLGQLQTAQFPSLVEHQHSQQPPQQDHVHGDPACIHVDTGSLPNTPDPAAARSPPAHSSHSPGLPFIERPNVGHSDSLTEDSATNVDKDSSRLDHGLNTIDWAELDNILGLSVAPSEKAPPPDCQPQFDDIFASTRGLDSPPHSNAMDLTRAVSFSPVASSYDDGREQRSAMPSYPSTNCLLTALGQGLFRSRLGSHTLGSENVTSAISETSSAEHHGGPSRTSSRGSTNLSRVNLFRSRESTLQPVTGSRCVLQCHVDLTNQLAHISECQGHDNVAALDMLLKLDNRIREAREKIVSCPVCMGKGRCGQTLMLLAMVASNLLGLFESSCGTRRNSSSSNNYKNNNNNRSSGSSSSSSNSSNSSRDDIDSRSDSWRDAVFGASPSVESSLSAVTDSTSAFRCLPYTSRPLTVGDVQLSEAVKLAFSRRLLRIYLDQQIGTFGQLSQMLAAAEVGDVNRKIAQELLEDASDRAERLLGYIALTDEAG